MATTYNTETTEEDASDLCFPKDNKKSLEFTLKTVRTFEKFPPLLPSTQHSDYGINYLIAISSGYWFMYHSKAKSLIVGPSSELYTLSEPKYIASYKDYPLHSTIHFEVTHIQAHPSHLGQLLLWGKHGIASVSVPMKESEKLHTKLIGEDLFVENVKLETVQVRFLPSSSASNIVVVLHSDHHIRLYDTATSTLMTEVSVGLPSQKNDIILSSEIPTDFDFGPFLPKSNLQLIFVLQESGALYYILLRTLDTIKKCYKELHGPLHLHEELDDFSVVPSKHTSLLVTKNFPVVVTTGDLSNTLKHFLLLPENDFESDEIILEEKILSGEMKLFLREKIILEAVCETDNNYLNLIPDPSMDSRYAVVTEAGIYLVNVSFIPEIRLFIKAQNESQALSSTASAVQFLVCWKVNDKPLHDKCLGGITFSDPVEQKLLIVLGDLRSIIVDVGSVSLQESTVDKLSEELSSGLAFGSFQDILKSVKQMLKKSATQPLMCSNQEVKGEDLEKFTVEALDLLVREYMERQEEALAYLQCSIKTLQVKTETTTENLEELMQNRIELRQAAEGIAEKYDERSNKNEEYQKRLETALHKQQKLLPAMTDQEKLWRKTLQEYQKDMELFKTSVESLKNKVQAEKVEKAKAGKGTESTLKLAPHQLVEIKNKIKKQHGDIERLTKEVRELKAALGIV